MLKSGSSAPDFALPDQNGATVRLKDLLSTGPLILYFYPADFTPGCTREACSIRGLHAELQQTGLTVVGVSPQSPESHRRFRDKYALPFTLLADPDKVAIKAYGVDGPFGFGVRRATFLIDRSARIQAAVLADLRIAEHEAFIRQALSTAGG